MLLIIALIFVVVLGKGVSEQSIATLKGTKQLQYTFYHIHTYPEPENMTIYIYFRQTGQQFRTLLSSFDRTLEKLHKSTKDYINKPKPTFIDHQPITSDFGSKQLILSSTIALQVLNESNLAKIVDEIQQISKTQSIKITSISREYWNLFNYQMEEQKARSQVQVKGRQICQKYFGMRYKGLESFEKWRDIIQRKNNQTLSQDEESDEFIGNLDEVYDEIDLEEYEQRYIEGNEVFKCSIICENIKNITQKDVQKLMKKAKPKEKITQKQIQHISKKSKKINLKKYQKQLQGAEF